MLKASPQHYEYVIKLRIPAFFSILPAFLQRMICHFSCLSFLAPRWDSRFLILLGGFVYKFQKENDPTADPKGSPLAISTVDINLLDTTATTAVVFASPLPDGYQGAFCLSTLRKKQYYATVSVEDAHTWVTSLRQARDESIKRHMKHAPIDSYPPAWTQFDRLGHNLAQRKDRIRQRLQDSSVRELEMSNLTEGGPAPRGYYG
jgi:hypothetical protein